MAKGKTTVPPCPRPKVYEYDEYRKFIKDWLDHQAGRDPDLLNRINMRTTLGDKHGAKPLDLSMPITIAPMSFGALSKSAKLSLAIASRLSGVSENTGEGGMTDAQRDRVIAETLSVLEG